MRGIHPRRPQPPPRRGAVALDPREHAVETLKDRYVHGEIDYYEFQTRLDGLIMR